MTNPEPPKSRFSQLKRFRHWLPLVIATLLIVGWVGWTYLNWQQRTNLVKWMEANGLMYQTENHGPDLIRRYVGYPMFGIPTNSKYGPFDSVIQVAGSRSKSSDMKKRLAELQVFPNLKVLKLGYTKCTDDWMPRISRLKSLQELDLCHCRISGRGFGRLADLTNLQSIELQYCPIRDQHLSQLAAVPNLKLVNLSSCSHVTADGVDSLLKLKPTCSVFLYGMKDLVRELQYRGYSIRDRSGWHVIGEKWEEPKPLNR